MERSVWILGGLLCLHLGNLEYQSILPWNPELSEFVSYWQYMGPRLVGIAVLVNFGLTLIWMSWSGSLRVFKYDTLPGMIIGSVGTPAVCYWIAGGIAPDLVMPAILVVNALAWGWLFCRTPSK